MCKCEAFRQLAPEKKLELVQGRRLCFNCFSSQHTAVCCPKSSRCLIDGCTRKHSTFLHMKQSESIANSQNVNVPVQNRHVNVKSTSFNYCRSTLSTIALPIVPVKIRSDKSQN